jgi:hypothetical protein
MAFDIFSYDRMKQGNKNQRRERGESVDDGSIKIHTRKSSW